MNRYLLTAGLLVGLAGYTASAQTSPSQIPNDPNQQVGVPQSTPPTFPTDRQAGDMDRNQSDSQTTDQDGRPAPDQNGVIHDRDDQQGAIHRQEDQQGTVYRDPNGNPAPDQDQDRNDHVGDRDRDQNDVAAQDQDPPRHIDDRDQNNNNVDQDRDNSQVYDQDQNTKKHKKHKKHSQQAQNDQDRDNDSNGQYADRDRNGAVGDYNNQESTTGANGSRDNDYRRNQDRDHDINGAAAGATGELRSQLTTAFQQQGLSNVNANVSDSEINLSGTVATGKDRQTARRIAQSYANGRQVHDNLTVSGRGRNQ